jgi:hypothetical protein
MSVVRQSKRDLYTFWGSVDWFGRYKEIEKLKRTKAKNHDEGIKAQKSAPICSTQAQAQTEIEGENELKREKK